MKLHVSMKVESLEGAIDFYTRLFGCEPIVRRADYAKWDVADPPVNFVVEPSRGGTGLDHLGIQAESAGELSGLVQRMRATGAPFLDVENTRCCYARMDKAWVKGAAGEKWEGFLTHSHDEEEYGADRESRLDAM